jgi:hypothetical protein
LKKFPRGFRRAEVLKFTETEAPALTTEKLRHPF